MSGLTCIVTVHGIGFQQPPSGDRAGYADVLHDHLRGDLGSLLGDDPERPTGGPVYVTSEVGGSRREGLRRLDPGWPLIRDGSVAHVALVYSPSEPLDPRPGALIDALARAAVSHSHYTSAVGAVHMLLSDAWAAIHQHTPVAADSSLRRRQDRKPPGSSDGAPGLLGTLQALEDDVATYVARNDLRERVRSFVEASLVGVLDRPDVDRLVVNAHSQGTVICWDVLARMPFSSWAADGSPRAHKLRRLITAGSPIRKYVDMFAWGELVGELGNVIAAGDGFHWQSFWDRHDPVADPLDPAASWRPGQPLDANPAGDDGLLVTRDGDGRRRHVSVTDIEVDNVQHSSGGGLQAHDYWNNVTEVVAPIAAVLRGLAAGGA